MVEVIDLTKKYGNNRGINNFNLTIKRGEIVGFLGPNGAGKTTTLNIISGFISPTEGKVFINGYDLNEYPFKAKSCLGYLPEAPPIYPELTVLSYLKFVSEIKGINKNDRNKKIDEVINAVKISDVKNRIIKNLSKGYKQRIGIAQALISNPKLIILDEPTVGLDPKQIIDIRSLIKNLGKDHTVIFSSHILSEVSAICDRVIIIDNGDVIAIDTPENLSKKIIKFESFLIKVKAKKEDFKKITNKINGIIKVKQKKNEKCPNGYYEYIVEHKMSYDVITPLFYSLAKNKYVIYELRPIEVDLENTFLQLIENKNNIK